jgi:imidazolonepropionase
MARRPLLIRFLDAALSLGLRCKIHADQHSCGGAVSLAAEYGATSIDHLEYATLEQARVLAAAETVATLLPCASFRHGHHAPARTLLDAGVPIALGTNFNPWHTPSLSMQTAVSLACLQLGMSPAQAITAATINAAHALHAAARVGSLEAGKLADVLILNCGDYRDLEPAVDGGAWCHTPPGPGAAFRAEAESGRRHSSQSAGQTEETSPHAGE